MGVRSGIRRAALAALAIVATVPALAPAAEAKQRKGPPVTVMTRNIYLGGNIFLPLGAKDRPQFEQLATELWNQVQTTNFPLRARLLAREVRRTKPDLIGLQEVALWRRGPDGVKDGSTTPATQVVYDFLRIYRRALRAAGQRYAVAVEQREADIEAPLSLGYDVRLTMHDVILVRKRPGLRIRKRLSDNYDTDIDVATPAGTLTSTRGWTAVDATFRGRRFRFVNTHLEAAGDPIREAQARELVSMAGPLRVRGPKILVGDMNSDPQGNESPSGAFDVLAGFGLVDVWPTIHPGDPGSSCCIGELLNDTTAAAFDHRIDLILTKPRLRGLAAQVVGDELGDRAPNGLWPSDHAGVVAKLRLR